MIDINTYAPYIYCEEVREELDIIVSNLESKFPDDIIPPEIFHRIWKEVDITYYEELMYILKKLTLQHIKNYIFECQEHIEIDDYSEDQSTTEDRVNYIVENFTHIKYIDIEEKIDVNINIFNISQVRNIQFDHKMTPDEVIEIFVNHIRRWKGKVRITDYTTHLSYDNGNIEYITDIYHYNEPREYTKLNYTLDQLVRLKPEGYISSTNNINDVLFALLLPGINRIIFNHIPNNYKLSDLLIKSTLLNNVDTTRTNDEIYNILSNIYVPNIIVDPKKSKIKHVMINNYKYIDSTMQNANKFASIGDVIVRYFKRIDIDKFSNLISMHVPIEVEQIDRWKNLTPNVKTYISYSNVMIKYYTQERESQKDTFEIHHRNTDIKYI